MTRPAVSTFSRRTMIAMGAVAVAALGAVAAPALNRTWFRRDARGAGSWWDRQSVSLERGGFNEWSRHVGSEFVTKAESGTATLRLIGVQPLNSAGARPADVLRDRAFVATFDSGGSSRPAGDRIYDVDHKGSGAMRIFFSEAPQASTHLEAVFN